MINLTIDGKAVQVTEGTTVLEAAQSAGVHIPTLCHHPALKPFGGCRLCLVEVEGARTLQPSCTMPAGEKMTVLTNTPKLQAARRFVLNMMFSDRNHFCPYCQVTGGDCDLQNAALEQGMTHWSFPPNWDNYALDASHKYFVIDHSRCILCHRCVRACGELVGNFTLGIEERGARSMLMADLGTPIGESSCISCGTCVAVCPTGALIERSSAYQGLDSKVTVTKSVCVQCSVGCGIEIHSRDNRVVRIRGDWDAIINGGVLCKLGRFLPLDEDRARIEQPMLRKDGQLVPVSYEEALNAVAARLEGARVAAIASTQLSVQSLALFKQIFGDALHADMLTSTEQGRETARITDLAEKLNRPFEGSLEALKQADCVLTLNANLGSEHQVAGFFIKRNVPNGAKLVMMESEMDAMAERANAFLQVPPAAIESALRGLEAAWVRLGVKGGDAFAALQTLEESAKAAGLSSEALLTAAGFTGASDRLVIVYDNEIGDSALAYLVQLADAMNATLLSMKGGANSLAAAQLHMDQPFALNGAQVLYAALADEAPAADLLEAAQQAAYVVVQTPYVSELTQRADVVLPVLNWLEQGGTYINLEGRVQQAVAGLMGPASLRTNFDVLAALAQELNLAPVADWQQVISERPAPVAMAVAA